MARISAWEFGDTAEFDGERLYAEVAPEGCSAARNGTLELTFTPGRMQRGTVFSHGLPGRDAGAFTLVLTPSGAVSMSCTEKDGAPLRLRTPDGFAEAGDRIQITLSCGVGGQFAVVNTDRLRCYPGDPEAGFVAPLPLRARCDLRGTHNFTFGAATGGMAPFFHGHIHRATLSDTVDAPTIAPPSADVLRVDFGAKGRVVPRRVSTPLTEVRRERRSLLAPARLSGPASMRVASATGDITLTDVEIGTELVTRGGGFAPVRWIGRLEMSRPTLQKRADLRPVILRKDALGPSLPEADIVLGHNQRILVPGAALADDGAAADGYLPAHVVQSSMGQPEAEAVGTAFVVFYCDRTVTVQVNGLWMEAINPFDQTLNASQAAWRDTMLTLFPGLRDSGGAARN